MTTERMIQAAIARADLIICSALRGLAVIAVLTIVLLLVLLSCRAGMGIELHWIDYDAPGVDITSEGPDDDYIGWQERR